VCADGLPNGDWTVGTSGQHYDYCGTGAGSQNGPAGTFDSQLAAAARTVPDPTYTTGWETLAVTTVNAHTAATTTTAASNGTSHGTAYVNAEHPRRKSLRGRGHGALTANSM
jgi:hypothetical protein